MYVLIYIICTVPELVIFFFQHVHNRGTFASTARDNKCIVASQFELLMAGSHNPSLSQIRIYQFVWCL